MIEVKQVGVTAGDVTLLAPVSFAVPQGQVLIVRGRNGTGKSTLLRVLAGVRKPSIGSVQINGSAVSQRDRRFRRSVSTMIGMPPMAVDLTVRDHVTLVATTWVDDPAGATSLAGGVLDELGLASLGERFVNELSSGQTQLFGLALMLARPFDLLILDEPEQRLDAEHVQTIIRVLQSRRDHGATLVVATHSSPIADALGDRVLELESAQ